ncbi:unnamed protein product [Clonostachys chloroleuca]|uniref:Glucose-methanol-choline oxidoreductase N-terminal domain-containing protein n=1 Tax=Clonostachys chloroleuca TaxID=1926264 RepID=A0AA35QDM2_9HYPO|nr:unnamed protein product [Clonostachys chloroleuca]
MLAPRNFKLVSALAWTLLPTSLAALPAGGTTNDSIIHDYVIIGSGAGGGTLAASLARKGHSVFLIEAGGDHGTAPSQQMPALWPTSGEDPEMSWNFYIRYFANETQGRRDSKFSYRLEDGSIYYGLDPPSNATPLGTLYPRGATLGGSSQTNAMNFIKPRSADWDYLAQLTGDESWGASRQWRNTSSAWKEFTTSQKVHRSMVSTSSTNTSDSWLRVLTCSKVNQNNVTYITGRPGTREVMSNLAHEIEGVEVDTEGLGHLLQRDVNGENTYTPGVYQLVVSTSGMRRRPGARDFLVDTANGSAAYQLTISTHSLATQILFDEKDVGEPTAVGVEYLVGEGLYGADKRYNPDQTGTLRRAFASKEVIVAGGAFNTPQILKLSGIGPREELESLGIPVVVDLPAVGKYLQDHTEGIVLVNSSVPWENDPNARCTMTLDETDPCYTEWLESGTGPYGEAAAPLAVSESEQADQFWFGFAGVELRGFYPGYSHPTPQPSVFTWDIVKLHQAGDGDHAKGTDPRDVPEIVFDWLQGDIGERDLDPFVEGAEVAYRAWDAAPAPYTPLTRFQPAEGVDLRQNLKDEAFGHHCSSTCRMGPKGNTDYCVDSELRVNGVKNLRIVDASIFPHTPGAFPVTSVYMLGIRAADIISESAKKQCDLVNF